MRPPVWIVLALLLVGCGDTTADGVGEVPRPSAAAGTSTTTVRSSSTTLPTSVTVVPEGNPVEDAAALMSQEWSTIELWADGWVEVSATAAGSAIAPRESEMGRLFSDDVHDAIEAAGATDTVAAYNAVETAGLISEVLEVLNDHPKAMDAIFAGPGTLSMTAATTADGTTWTTRGIPFVSPGELRASASDGTRLALLLGARSEREMRIAVTADLDNWSVAVLASPFTVGIGAYGMAPLPGGGWLVVAESPDTGDARPAWVVSHDGQVIDTIRPGEGRCCRLEATSAGVFAYDNDSAATPEAWFSTDGVEWEARTAPDGLRITGAASVRGGLVITTRDDAAGSAAHWRGTPAALEWESIALPEEIEWEVSLDGAHHEGVAQFVAVPAWGRRGYRTPTPSVAFTVESDGLRFDIVADAGLDDGSMAVTVTDLASGVAVFDKSGPSGDTLPSWVLAVGPELQLVDDDGRVIAALSAETYEWAFESARAEAEAAADALRTPTEQAFLSSTYLLHSLDGLTWSSMIIQPSGESFSPRLAASINGTRALIGDDYHGYQAFELVDE